jgi:pyridoxal biosynthesis lyase PdxS
LPNNPETIAQVSKNLGEAMPEYDIKQLKTAKLLAAEEQR